MQNFLSTLWNDESGQDLAEYALLLAFIAIVVAVGVVALGDNLTDFFTDVGNAFGDIDVDPIGGGGEGG